MQIYFFFLNLISFPFFLAFVTVHLLVKGKVLSRQLRRVRPHPNVKKKRHTKNTLPPKNGRPAARDFRPTNGSLLHGFDISDG